MRTAGVAAVAAAAGRGPIVCVAVLAKKKIQNYKKNQNYIIQLTLHKLQTALPPQTSPNRILNLGIVLQIISLVLSAVTSLVTPEGSKHKIYWMLLSSHFTSELLSLDASDKRSVRKHSLWLSIYLVKF